MIKNDRQYKITRGEADRFARALVLFDETSHQRRDVDPRLVQAERDALASQYKELTSELQAYEALKRRELEQ